MISLFKVTCLQFTAEKKLRSTRNSLKENSDLRPLLQRYAELLFKPVIGLSSFGKPIANIPYILASIRRENFAFIYSLSKVFSQLFKIDKDRLHILFPVGNCDENINIYFLVFRSFYQ